MNGARRLRGFTLIEILVVITIITAVSGVVVSAINPLELSNRGRDTKYKTDGQQVITAVDRYFATTGEYPWVTSGEVYSNTEPFGFKRVSDRGVGVCGTNCSLDGVLVTKNELKEEFKDRSEVRTTSSEDTIYVGKAYGPNEPVYTCYIPKSKKEKDEAISKANVYTINFTFGTRAKTASCNTIWDPTCFVCIPEGGEQTGTPPPTPRPTPVPPPTPFCSCQWQLGMCATTLCSAWNLRESTCICNPGSCGSCQAGYTDGSKICGADNTCPTPPPTPTPTPAPTPTPCPLPPPPGGLFPAGTLPACGTQRVSVGWNQVSDPANPGTLIGQYAFRLDDTTTGWTENCSNPFPGDVCNDSVDNRVSVTGVSGRTYRYWAHSINACGWSAPANNSFSVTVCPTPTPTPAPYQYPYPYPYPNPYQYPTPAYEYPYPYPNPYQDPYQYPYPDPYQDPYPDPYQDPYQYPYPDPYQSPCWFCFFE